ncbi:HAD family acid phosphatase [Sphingomonas montanisoli]|uniref:Acid phosphatase n=1 Tax=Sphingomonas montanisoli TaxID=2606412 RepID=A0A5D9CCY6_9SPHN|nr:acid phosphatase [Sphingomonas montanisoli]
MKRVAALGALAGLSACAATPQQAVTAPSSRPAGPGPTYQYLYGSGEGGAISVQAYAALLNHVAAVGRPKNSVVLAEGSTLAAPSFVPCGDKPLAAVFDVDETVLLNLGFEEKDARRGGGPFDSRAWDRWERTGAAAVAPVPGAVYAMRQLRAKGVTVIFNTNRSAETADQTVAAVKNAGLGDFVHGQTLFLQGDDSAGSKKDGRRSTIASRYCVIAMGGDQLGDFSDLFNQIASPRERREAAGHGDVARLWGNGWFMLPNPVYGPGLRGGFDDVFPTDKRWDDPAQGAN